MGPNNQRKEALTYERNGRLFFRHRHHRQGSPGSGRGRGGSGLGRCTAALRSSAPGAKVLEGRMLNGTLSQEALKYWAEGLRLG